jgi:catalase
VELADPGSKGVVKDKGVVTMVGSSDMKAFCKRFFEAIARHRHWEREKYEEVPA